MRALINDSRVNPHRPGRWADAERYVTVFHLDITNHIGYMARDGCGAVYACRRSPALMAGAFGSRRPQPAKQGLVLRPGFRSGRWTGSEPAPPLPRTQGAELASFPCLLADRSQVIDAKPSLSCQANQSAGFRPLAFFPGVRSAFACGRSAVPQPLILAALAPDGASFAILLPGGEKEVSNAPNPRPSGERDTQAWFRRGLAGVG